MSVCQSVSPPLWSRLSNIHSSQTMNCDHSQTMTFCVKCLWIATDFGIDIPDTIKMNSTDFSDPLLSRAMISSKQSTDTKHER